MKIETPSVSPLLKWNLVCTGKDYTKDKAFIHYQNSKGQRLEISITGGDIIPCCFGC